MSRALLLCPEPVRRLTAGVGTRFVSVGRVLAEAGHEVRLAVPNDPAEAEAAAGLGEVVRADPERLGELAEECDWVLLHGHLGNHYLCQRDDLPVVVDLYDPFLVENLHYHRELGFAPYNTDHATWRLQMARGDLFLVSSEEQRLYYLGWLSALGRVNPLAIEADPSLERLVVELPFGTPEGAPPPAPARETVLPGIDAGAPVLYFGGIYDWYDVDVVLEALALLERGGASPTLVFTEHPHPELTPRSAATRARTEAERRGWLGGRVRFEPWRPSARRFELAQVADLAVVTHRPGLETELSLRTRLVDLLWLGLAVVVTEGGAMSRVVAEHGCGLVVPPADPETLADAVRELLADPGRRAEMGAAGRRWAAERSWPRVAAPLLEFARSPRRDPYRDRFAALAPAPPPAREPLLRRLRRRLGMLR